MKQELLDIEVTRYTARYDEIDVEPGKATRDEILSFIKSEDYKDIIAIKVITSDREHYWNRYTRTWKTYHRHLR